MLIKNRPRAKMRKSLRHTEQSESRGGTRSAARASPIGCAMTMRLMISFSSQERSSKRDSLRVSRLESVNRDRVTKNRLDPAEVKGLQTKTKRILKRDLPTLDQKMYLHLWI